VDAESETGGPKFDFLSDIVVKKFWTIFPSLLYFRGDTSQNFAESHDRGGDSIFPGRSFSKDTTSCRSHFLRSCDAS